MSSVLIVNKGSNQMELTSLQFNRCAEYLIFFPDLPRKEAQI